MRIKNNLHGSSPGKKFYAKRPKHGYNIKSIFGYKIQFNVREGMYVCMNYFIDKYAPMYACMYLCKCVGMHLVCIYVYVCIICINVCMNYIHLYVCMHVLRIRGLRIAKMKIYIF